MERLVVKSLSLELPNRLLLDDVSFLAESGSCLAVTGPLGSGKTTLLNCLCGITMSTSGSVYVDGKELSSTGMSERSSFRLREIGMIFQFGKLLPELTVLENVTLPLRLMGLSRDEVERRGGRGWPVSDSRTVVRLALRFSLVGRFNGLVSRGRWHTSRV